MNILHFILLMYVFWLSAIASLNLYRGWVTGKITPKMPVYYLAVPTMIVFVLFDLVMNYTVFLWLCMEMPEKKTELVTQRLSRYRSNPNTNAWRKGVANFVCGLLNIFNFNDEDHC